MNGFAQADKLAMAHSIEIRCPFADVDLWDFVYTLPLKYLHRPGEHKALLKDAVRGLVPDHVLANRKLGFTPDLDMLDRLSNKLCKAGTTSELTRAVTDRFLANIESRKNPSASQIVPGQPVASEI